MRNVRRAAWVAVLAVALLAVFALPWVVPVPVKPVVSDSQAAGFSNRAATIGLALCALAAVAFAARRSARGHTGAAFATVAPGDPVDRRLVVAAMGLAVVAVVGLASVYRGHPYSDAQYFVDRMLLATSGNVPYRDFEFTYGPLMLYLPLALSRFAVLLGGESWLGYYAFVALIDLVGIAALAWLLRRLELTRAARNVLFSLVVLWTLLQLPLWANYTLFRFLAGYVAFTFGLRAFTTGRHAPWRACAPAVAVALAACVSFEMGVAAAAALGVSLAVIALRRPDRRRSALASGAVLALAVAALAALIVGISGMVGAFAGGAFQMPVLPSALAVLYVVSVLLVAGGTGDALTSVDAEGAAASAGWFALALVLSAPSLSRADAIHLFANGLGMFLAAAAALSARRTARGPLLYAAALGVAALPALLFFQGSAMLPGALAAGVRAGTISRPAAESVARRIGDPRIGTRYATAAVPDVTAEQAQRLAERGTVAVLAPLDGMLASSLAERRRLVPTYIWQVFAVTEPMARRMTDQAAEADFLVMPRDVYADYASRAAASGPTTSGAPMVLREWATSRRFNAQFMSVPVAVPARNPVLDAQALVAEAVVAGWEFDSFVGPYVVMRRSR